MLAFVKKITGMKMGSPFNWRPQQHNYVTDVYLSPYAEVGFVSSHFPIRFNAGSFASRF